MSGLGNAWYERETETRTHVASVHRMILKKILLKLGLGVNEVAFGGQVRRVFLNRALAFGASHAPSYSPYVGFLKMLCLLIFQLLQKIKDAEPNRAVNLKAIFLSTDLENPNAWEVVARSAYEKCSCMRKCMRQRCAERCAESEMMTSKRHVTHPRET